MRLTPSAGLRKKAADVIEDCNSTEAVTLLNVCSFYKGALADIQILLEAASL